MNDHFEPMERSDLWLSDPADAAAWTQINQEASAAIEGLSVQELRDVVSDRNRPERIRCHALHRLPADEVTCLLGDLLWNDDDNYWTVMIGCFRLDSQRVRSGLHRHRKSSVLRNRLAAITGLSILKDTSVLADIDDVLMQTGADDSVSTLRAIHALGRLACSESRDRLIALIRDERLAQQVRVCASEEMLSIGQVSPALEYLTSIAATCRGMEAPNAARSIRTVDRPLGNRLMLAILENGDVCAKQIAVFYLSAEMDQLDAPFIPSGLQCAKEYLRSLISE